MLSLILSHPLCLLRSIRHSKDADDFYQKILNSKDRISFDFCYGASFCTIVLDDTYYSFYVDNGSFGSFNFLSTVLVGDNPRHGLQILLSDKCPKLSIQAKFYELVEHYLDVYKTIQEEKTEYENYVA